MSGVSMELIKKLREKTGAGVMDVKNALTEAGGDAEKATEILRQKGIATADKKSDRPTADGSIVASILNNGQVGSLIEINCETDFVSKSPAFQEMVKTLGEHVAQQAPETVDAMLGQPLFNDNSRTVKDLLAETIGSVKENMVIRRFVRYQHPDANGCIHAYIHAGGKMGVLLEVATTKTDTLQNPAFQQLVKDLGMQIAGAASEYVSRQDIPQSVIDRETEVEMGKEDLQNKPPEIRAKIVEGRVNKIVGQGVLLEQPFVKDTGKTVQQLLEEVSGQVGDTVTVVRFTRYVLGEEIATASHAKQAAAV